MDHCRRRRFAALHSDAAGGGDRATAAAAGSLAATPALALGSDVSGHAGNHSIYLRTGLTPTFATAKRLNGGQ